MKLEIILKKTVTIMFKPKEHYILFIFYKMTQKCQLLQGDNKICEFSKSYYLRKVHNMQKT